MFTEQDREDIAEIKRALLIDIAEGRDDLTNTGSIAKRIQSMHAGDFGERKGYVKGSLGWLDRRLERIRKLIVNDVLEALGHEVEPDPTDTEPAT